MTRLLDGNVLVAVCIDTHVHHELALEWLEAKAWRFATCAVTEGTLLRMSMTLAEDRSSAAAWETLRLIRAHRRHVYWDDGFSYGEVPFAGLMGGRQVTDAWLAELCRRRKAKLATLDSGLAALHSDVTELIRG